MKNCLTKFEVGKSYVVRIRDEYSVKFVCTDRMNNYIKLDLVDMQVSNFKSMLNLALAKYYSNMLSMDQGWLEVNVCGDEEYVKLAEMFCVIAVSCAE